MRWLLAQLCRIPVFIGAVAILVGIYLGATTGEWSSEVVIFSIGGGFLNAYLFTHFQEKLLDRHEMRRRRRMIRIPRRAKPEPVAVSVPQGAPVPQKRAFAPIPQAQEVNLETVEAQRAVPERLQRFIERGDQAIRNPAGH